MQQRFRADESFLPTCRRHKPTLQTESFLRDSACLVLLCNPTAHLHKALLQTEAFEGLSMLGTSVQWSKVSTSYRAKPGGQMTALT